MTLTMNERPPSKSEYHKRKCLLTLIQKTNDCVKSILSNMKDIDIHKINCLSHGPAMVTTESLGFTIYNNSKRPYKGEIPPWHPERPEGKINMFRKDLSILTLLDITP